MSDNDSNRYLIEFRPSKNMVKVSAVDPVTKTEVSMAIPAKGLTQRQMSQLAVQKLEYVLRKQQAKKPPSPQKDEEDDGLYV